MNFKKLSDGIYLWKELDLSFIPFALLGVSILFLFLLIYLLFQKNNSWVFKVLSGYFFLAFCFTTYFSFKNPPRASEITIDTLHQTIKIADTYYKNPFALPFSGLSFYSINSRLSSLKNRKSTEVNNDKYYNLNVHFNSGFAMELFESSSLDSTMDALKDMQNLIELPVINLERNAFYFPKNENLPNNQLPTNEELSNFDRMSFVQKDSYSWDSIVHPALLIAFLILLPIFFSLVYTIWEDGLSMSLGLFGFVVLVLTIGFGFGVISRLHSKNQIVFENSKISYNVTGLQRGLGFQNLFLSNIICLSKTTNSSTLEIIYGEPEKFLREKKKSISPDFLSAIAGYPLQRQVPLLMHFYEGSPYSEMPGSDFKRYFVDMENLSTIDQIKLFEMLNQRISRDMIFNTDKW